MHVALITCAILRSPNGPEQAARIRAEADEIFPVGESAPGLVARALHSDDREDLEDGLRDWAPWGSYAVPDLSLTEAEEPYRVVQTLSVWEGYSAVRDFAYERLHRPAPRDTNRFLHCPWPNYCLWWIEPGHQVTWTEAAARLDYFHGQGETPVAFTFQMPFDSLACPIDGS